MATWALGRSNSVDSRHPYTTHLAKIIVGDLDQCCEPIRSFSERLIGPVAWGTVIRCSQLSSPLGMPQQHSATCSVPCPSSRLCLTLVKKGWLFPKECNKNKSRKCTGPGTYLCPVSMQFLRFRHLLTVSCPV